MNFELIDNFIQVGVMLVAAVADIIFWFRQKDRIYIILALEHGCFMMGLCIMCYTSSFAVTFLRFFM